VRAQEAPRGMVSAAQSRIWGWTLSPHALPSPVAQWTFWVARALGAGRQDEDAQVDCEAVGLHASQDWAWIGHVQGALREDEQVTRLAVEVLEGEAALRRRVSIRRPLGERP
jgi:hypothetical protein